MGMHIDWAGPWSSNDDDIPDEQRQMVVDAHRKLIMAGDWVALSDACITGRHYVHERVAFNHTLALHYLHRRLGLVEAVEDLSIEDEEGNPFYTQVYRIRWGWTLDEYPDTRYYRYDLILAPDLLVGMPEPYDTYGLYLLRGLWSFNLTATETQLLVQAGVSRNHIPTALLTMFAPDAV